MPKPQHLTLSSLEEGYVHFVEPREWGFFALCNFDPDCWNIDSDWNRYARRVDCPECLAVLKKRGWDE